MPVRMTKKEVMQEIVKCGGDAGYFISNYAKITHPLKGLIPFRIYDFQADLLESFENHRFNVILKARQLGISTITAAYISWLMLFHREKNVLVIATKFGTAANLVKKVKSILKTLPDFIKLAKVDVDNRTSFVLSNGSQIKASSTSGDAGRSEALSLLVIDEAAHVDGLDELWMGLYPTLSTGGRCIALSTPNGVGNWFHKNYVEATTESNDFFPTKLMWDVHPDRDLAWFEKETKNMSRREIAQELECNFNMSGETVFHGDDIALFEGMICDPKRRTGFDRNFWIWEDYIPGQAYLVSADVARGDGADYSVFHVLKLSTMEVVAEYQGKVTPDIFSNILYSSGREYGDSMIVVENNSVGFAVLDKLIELEYPNVYFSIKSTHEFVEQSRAEYKSNAVAGFTTSTKTRPLIIAKLEEFVRNKLIKVYSSRLLNEMRTFVWNNGKPEAMRSYNDDLIMSLAVACWVRDTAILENKKDVEYSKAIMNSISKSTAVLNTNIKGMIDYKQNKLRDTMEKHAANVQEFPWLFKG